MHSTLLRRTTLPLATFVPCLTACTAPQAHDDAWSPAVTCAAPSDVATHMPSSCTSFPCAISMTRAARAVSPGNLVMPLQCGMWLCTVSQCCSVSLHYCSELNKLTKVTLQAETRTQRTGPGSPPSPKVPRPATMRQEQRQQTTMLSCKSLFCKAEQKRSRRRPGNIILG